MLKTIESGETRISSDPSNKDISNNVSRQVGNFSLPLGKRLLLAAFVGVTGLAADSQAKGPDNFPLQAAQVVDPSTKIELPEIQVPTGDFETINRGGVQLTRIYGDNDPDNRLFVQILLQGKATKELAKKIVEDFFLVDPMSKYLDRFTFWVRTDPGIGNLDCVLWGECNSNLVKAKIDETHNATGIYSPETIVLINNGGLNGRAAIEGYSAPSIYSYAGIVTTMEAGGSARQLTDLEIAKSILNLSDLWRYNGTNQSVGIGFPNCSRNPEMWGFSRTQWLGCYTDDNAYRSDDQTILRDRSINHFGIWESQWIDKLIKLFPGNYQYPPFKLSLYRTNPVTGKGFPQGSLDLGIKLDIPYGTKNMAVELIPSADKETGAINSPGVTLQFTDTAFINKVRQEGFILSAPKMGEGPYITLPGMGYTWRVRVSPDPTLPFTDGPGWETVQATPVLTIPNKGRGEVKDFAAPRGSEKISFLLDGKTTNNLALSLQWVDGNSDAFYYELQVSLDPTFEKDPAKATAAVWENLIHGGESKPLNSWKVPAGLLEPRKTYYMRAKPRVQGDGISPEWSSIASFKTSADARVLAANELEGITQPTTKQIITKEEHERNVKLAQAKDAERLAPMWNHWQWVNRRVQSDWSVYRRQEDLASAA